jgi:hypothetical protein
MIKYFIKDITSRYLTPLTLTPKFPLENTFSIPLNELKSISLDEKNEDKNVKIVIISTEMTNTFDAIDLISANRFISKVTFFIVQLNFLKNVLLHESTFIIKNAGDGSQTPPHGHKQSITPSLSLNSLSSSPLSTGDYVKKELYKNSASFHFYNSMRCTAVTFNTAGTSAPIHSKLLKLVHEMQVVGWYGVSGGEKTSGGKSGKEGGKIPFVDPAEGGKVQFIPGVANKPPHMFLLALQVFLLVFFINPNFNNNKIIINK